MNLSKKLELAQGHAERMLLEAYDAKSGFPITADSHPDFWPGDAARWVAGYLAIEQPNIAQDVMHAVGESVRPDGGIAHYRLGSHKRLGGRVETNVVDRYVQAFSGNGIERSVADKWVSSIYAAPTAAIAALTLYKAGVALPQNISVKTILGAHNRLTKARRGEDMLLGTHYSDELTNNSGDLAKKLKTQKRVVDPAVNALYVNNERAIAELISSETIKQPTPHQTVAETAPHTDGKEVKNTQTALEEMIATEHSMQDVLSLESTLAAARLGLMGLLRDNDLLNLFRAPAAHDKHPEQTRASLPDALEAARLTASSFEVSRIFLGRMVSKIAENSHMLTRYEDVGPGDNVIANRAYRRELWAPTAAEICQLTLEMID